jgi:2-amino-4-hydroxy-6-hydroxymethyldihydropteridine diphosphokinase
MNHLAVVLFGANLGDREKNIRVALENLQVQFGKPERLSALYQTAAWGTGPQPQYLNCVAGYRTILPATEVLSVLLKTEETAGRMRNGHQYEPRTIDLDLLLFDNEVIHLPGLQVPHPRMNLRKFTLVPLAAIYPDLVHPVEKITVSELLMNCPDEGEVQYYKELE